MSEILKLTPLFHRHPSTRAVKQNQTELWIPLTNCSQITLEDAHPFLEQMIRNADRD
jgi:hypothetical protein